MPRAADDARMGGMGRAAVDEQLETIEAGWRQLRGAVDRLGWQGWERRTAAGWTVKEMVAHVAFWEETVDPVVNGMYRGGEVPLEQWYGGDDLGLAPGDPWPVSAVHNAREAAWARPRSADEVLARWDRAHERLLAVVSTITDAEAQDEKYLGKVGAATYEHYVEHLPEIEGLDPRD